ncbi:unnamed protein product [Tilletia controversa]|uniref:Uncharacterized protein n=1 Tax=Tilletia caries TaxID=13290 RepID=A0ABN7J335_9BASI|nr:hypothetical protein CF336_g3165 [Tilletia laevis]KAE8203972.1 hypothetical protein CF328_g1350 [Tilletia controversa]CAD6926322.1 unnamed protein product [Tilletia laevis]CAD6949246.1 unnamed protein product [Tilletia caries]CAD6959098.1 unnamed protein product [Tilletia controversa]
MAPRATPQPRFRARIGRTHSLHYTLGPLLLAVALVLLSIFSAQAGVNAAPAPAAVERNQIIPPVPQPANRAPNAESRALRAAARIAPSPLPALAARVTQAPNADVLLERNGDVDAVLRWYQSRPKAKLEKPTRVERDETPNVPLSQLGPPSFPAEFPSCGKCEEKYSSLSSCMEASSVFQNATNIFNSPLSYFAVIKCACTDTFQAVYPQCLDCFQHTNQCWYLGTDPQGTGAPAIISNIRNICGFGSALLGGVATANGQNGSGPAPSSVGTYTDVNPTDYRPGYNDQSAGPIFGGAVGSRGASGVVGALAVGLVVGVAMLVV